MTPKRAKIYTTLAARNGLGEISLNKKKAYSFLRIYFE